MPFLCLLLTQNQQSFLQQVAGAARQEMGVYVGISYNEYSQLAAAQGPGMSSYTATGGSLSVAAGLSRLH